MTDRALTFGWTVPSLLSGNKTRTSRDWDAARAMLYREGDTIDAWDRSPKSGGHRIARLRVTRDAYLQNTADFDDSVYAREGFAYLDESGYRPLAMVLATGKPKDKMWRALFDKWRATPKTYYVVEFTLASRFGTN